jgi:hypothetical protein
MGIRGPQVEGWIAIGDEGSDQDLQRHELTLPSESWETLTFPLPQGGSDRVLVEIGVKQPMVPNELDPKLKDRRVLGVAVREVALL